MTFDFYDQTAVVTGGTRGIGRAVAEAFLNAGADVICLYGGDEAAADRMREEFATVGGLTIQKLDVSDADAVRDFWRGLEKDEIYPEIVVNSAGIRRDNVLAMMPEEDWRRVMDVNLGGVFTMCKYAVQAMSGRRYGRIVNMTSPSGQLGFEGQANYAASKAGMVALSKSLSKEVARRNITVNCVSPGFIDTDFIRDLPEDQAKRYKQMVPLRRFGKAQEVADAVLFLASKESAYITGATLDITGGL
ncbi:MAG: 3-oxoacyl-ACP reductase FabG [Planctomycetaceae bacterium]|nr:3-oxoacyl-ACP reductase FabG [Planctomycetaceae bacterium]